MGYTYSKEEYEKMPKGDYECFIESMQLGETLERNEPKINIRLRVRDDIEQNMKNRVIFDSIYLDKNNPNIFDTKKINRILSSQNDIQDNQYFETIQDVIDFLVGKTVLISLNYFADKNNADKEYQTLTYKVSKYQPKKFTTTTNKETSSVVDDLLSEEDLPF